MDNGEDTKEERSSSGVNRDAEQETEPRAQEGDSEGGGGREVGYVYFIETNEGQYVKIGYSVKPVRMPRRKAIIIGQVRDMDGELWDVREVRATRHGFDIAIGWPEGQRGQGYAGPAVILTPELIAYFEAHRLERDGSIYDLPLGRTAIKRVRRLLGLNYYADVTVWWLDRLEDLAALNGAEFARKHAVQQSEVSQWHSAIFGNRQRVNGWWREEPACGLLVSNYPRAYVADRLELSIGAVGRLRWVLRQERTTECNM